MTLVTCFFCRRKINSDRGLGENDYYNKQMTPDQQQQQQTSVSSDVVPDSKPKAKVSNVCTLCVCTYMSCM